MTTATARDLARERRAWALPGSRWDRIDEDPAPRLSAGRRRVILLTGLIWPLTQDREFSFILSKDRVDMAGDRMRLGEAVYRGEDARGRPFEIRADSGVQQTSADPRVVLVGLAARMNMDEGVAVVTAPRGIYDLERQRLVVAGPVRVRRPDGYRLVTSDVTVDIPSRRIVSDERVVGALPLGTFAADTLSADIEDRSLVLEGDVKLEDDAMTHRPFQRHRKAALAAMAAMAALLAGQVWAQALPGASLRSFDRGAPIDVSAARVEVTDREDQALLSGGVEISQATLDLAADSVRVFYLLRGGDVSIDRLDARGGVRVETPQESARARSAIYDVGGSRIILIGDVVLERGPDVLRGGRLTIDLNSGRSTFDAAIAANGERGRVTGRFTPSGGE